MNSSANMKWILVSVLIDSQGNYLKPKSKELTVHRSSVHCKIGEHLCMGEQGIKTYDLCAPYLSISALLCKRAICSF